MASSPDLTPPEVDEPGTKKCSGNRIKSVIKTIFAQLFSHLGLCLLVVGYSLMGAVIFVSLEREHEMQIRRNVSSLKNQTLDQLYNLTGKNFIVM